MDADVMITIAFCLEVFLFGLAAGLFVAREARRSRPEATAADALATFPATDVLLALPPEEGSYWLERDLPAKARALSETAPATAHRTHAKE